MDDVLVVFLVSTPVSWAISYNSSTEEDVPVPVDSSAIV